MPKTRKAPPAAPLPAHVSRPAKGRRKRPARTAPAREYPPGWFTRPVLAWWPDFKPAAPVDTEREGLSASARASAIRERRMADGHAAAAGTMALPNTPKGLAPAWLKASAAARGKC